MAADVCAEQLPSTSLATGTTSSSSSTTSSTSAAQEVDQIASSSTACLGSCYMNQNACTTTVNHYQEEEEARSAFANSLLPSELHLHILKHLPRHDIDNCKFVCKRWKEMIDRNKHSLRKHDVQTLELREYKSRFILTLNCPTFTKRWTFCDRAANRPSPELGKRRHTKTSISLVEDDRQLQQQQQQQEQHQQQQQQPAAKLHHLLVYVGQSSPPGSFLPVLVPAVLSDSTESTEDHDERKRREHTPPQLVCERIAKYFHEADIYCMRFTEMRFTDRFVDRLLDAFGTRKVRCKKLEISLCKLNYINAEKFHQFLHLFECEKISLIWLRGIDGHVNNSRQFLSPFLCLRSLRIVALTPEIIIGDDQFLTDFLNGKATKYSEETVLRLDWCSITTSGLCQAIEKWMQTGTRWTLNLCLVSQHIEFDELLKHFFIDRTKPPRSGAYQLAHPQRPGETLSLWDDADGLHVASTRHLIS